MKEAFKIITIGGGGGAWYRTTPVMYTTSELPNWVNNTIQMHYPQKFSYNNFVV